LVYNDEVGKNLYDIIAIHGYSNLSGACTDINLADFGMTINFEVVKDYKIGSNNTNQADFITLKDGVITAKVFSTNGRAAIGRTPIIRATLYDKNKKPVEVAYIKVKIVEKEKQVITEDFTIEMDDFAYHCPVAGYEPYDTVKTTVEQINVQLYNELQKIGVTREEFYSNYEVDVNTLPETTTADWWTADPRRNGVVKEIVDTHNGETTHLLQWAIALDTLWAHAGENVEHVIAYKQKAGATTNVAPFTVKLISKVAGIKKAYDVTSADYYAEYWNSTMDLAKFNVNVVDPVGTTSNAKCLFQNDLNSPFVTWPRGDEKSNDGLLKLDASVNHLVYSFKLLNNGVETIGDTTYVFGVKEIGAGTQYELYAAVKGAFGSNQPSKSTEVVKADGTIVNAGKTELIATITNDNTWTPNWPAGGRNKVELNPSSQRAKYMLNTRDLKLNFSVYGYVCDDASKKVTVTFQGEDHFTAQYIRPVTSETSAAKGFIDGVDLGEEGSIRSIMDLVPMKDWRGRVFGQAKAKKDGPTAAGDFELGNYWNYWLNAYNTVGGYYGITKIEFLPNESQCDLNGNKQAVPATIVLKQEAAGYTSALKKDQFTSPFGNVSYKNNGTPLQSDINLFLKFKVTYKWGEFITDEITVPVKATTIAAPRK